MGEAVSIAPGPDNTTQTVSFKDRSSAEELFFGSRDILGVGGVDFAWVQTPLTRGKLEPEVGKDGDTLMVEARGSNESDGTGIKREEREREGEVDYDIAEADERWT